MNSNNKTAVYGGKNIHQHCKMITVKSLSGNCLSIISSDTYRNIKKLKQKKNVPQDYMTNVIDKRFTNDT